MSGLQPRATADLDAQLRRLGARITYPATPDLVVGLRAGLAAAPHRPALLGWLWRPRSRAALALASLAVLLATASAAVLLLSPQTRAAVADRLGLPGLLLEYVPTLPAPNQPPGAPRPDDGPALTLAEARTRVGFPILAPDLPELGEPDAVYVSSELAGGVVSLVYRERAGIPTAPTTGAALVVTQFLGAIQVQASPTPDSFGKGIGPGTRVQALTVNGRQGYWIEGEAHVLASPRGGDPPRSLRLAGNTLVWEQGDLTLRLESALRRDQALRIAASVR